MNSNQKIALANKYGTPLYVYDEDKIVEEIKKLKDHFVSDKYETEILYASKAFSIKAMYELVSKMGLGIDVVSGGEIYTAYKANFDLSKAYFHGNNKTNEEITLALELGVKNFVVDNSNEALRLKKIAEEMKKEAFCLIRVNLGISAHTHKYIVTSAIDSKFGMEYHDEEFDKTMEIINSSKYLHFEGFHSHIGSQIFDLNPFVASIDKLAKISLDYDHPLVINLGGGYGIYYTDEDKPISLDVVAETIIKAVDEANINIKKLIIEPGRCLVGEAGYTIYSIGDIKKTRNKKYYYIDGGMTDNIRPCLYEAKYSCDILEKIDEEKTEVVTVAGKCCESGDIIIESALLPKASTNDHLIVYSTGAYGYSMSSNYNRNPRPAVVFTSGCKARMVVKRESLMDLMRNEVEGSLDEI